MDSKYSHARAFSLWLEVVNGLLYSGLVVVRMNLCRICIII